MQVLFFRLSGVLNIFSSDADNIFLMNQKIILIMIWTTNIPHFFLLLDWWETRESQPKKTKNHAVYCDGLKEMEPNYIDHKTLKA